MPGPLLTNGQDPATALAPVRDGDVSLVVRGLAQRYLVHARTSPALTPDLRLLYGLALLYGDTGRAAFPGAGSRGGQLDPDALSALWDVAAGEVAARLDGLAARHDFVLSGSRRLHQEVREAVLLFLLDPLERPAVREMNTRAAAHYRARAAAADHATVDAQVTDQRWQTAVISLLWHIFWTDLDQGLETLSLFAAAVTLDEAFAAAMLRVAAFFAPACPADGQRLIGDLQLVAQMLSGLQLGAETPRPGPAGSIRNAINAVTKRAAEPLLATAPPVAVYHDLLLLRAGQSALIAVESSMTWLLVSTSPLELITIPVPAARSLLYCSVVLMITTPGFTLVTMACSPPATGAAGPAGGTASPPGMEMPELDATPNAKSSTAASPPPATSMRKCVSTFPRPRRVKYGPYPLSCDISTLRPSSSRPRITRLASERSSLPVHPTLPPAGRQCWLRGIGPRYTGRDRCSAGPAGSPASQRGVRNCVEGAHVAFGYSEKQHLVARAAVHIPTVATQGRKNSPSGGNFRVRRRRGGVCAGFFPVCARHHRHLAWPWSYAPVRAAKHQALPISDRASVGPITRS